MMIFAPLSNVWVQRFGNKIVVAAGLLLVATSFVAVHDVRSRTAASLHVIVVTMLMGLGMANVMAPVHRLDHGLAAAGEGRRRLGGERHDPADGRRGRRRGVRLADGQPLHATISGQARLACCRAALFAQVKDNVGQAVGIAAQVPGAQPFCGQIVDRGERQLRQRPAHQSALVAAGITLLAARRRRAVPAGPRSRRGRRERLRSRARAGCPCRCRMTLSDAEVLRRSRGPRPRGAAPRPRV